MRVFKEPSNSLKFIIMLTIHKAYQPGEIGRIVSLYADFYSKLVGFGLPFCSQSSPSFVRKAWFQARV